MSSKTLSIYSNCPIINNVILDIISSSNSAIDEATCENFYILKAENEFYEELASKKAELKKVFFIDKELTDVRAFILRMLCYYVENIPLDVEKVEFQNFTLDLIDLFSASRSIKKSRLIPGIELVKRKYKLKSTASESMFLNSLEVVERYAVAQQLSEFLLLHKLNNSKILEVALLRRLFYEKNLSIEQEMQVLLQILSSLLYKTYKKEEDFRKFSLSFVFSIYTHFFTACLLKTDPFNENSNEISLISQFEIALFELFSEISTLYDFNPDNYEFRASLGRLVCKLDYLFYFTNVFRKERGEYLVELKEFDLMSVASNFLKFDLAFRQGQAEILNSVGSDTSVEDQNKINTFLLAAMSKLYKGPVRLLK
jgi:hypothetical protein